MKLLQHIPGKFQECCDNVAAKRKNTSPQHYGNIHRQRRSVMISTMFWQPFCNLGKIRVDHIRTFFSKKIDGSKKVMPTPFHWLILCSTSAKQMPVTKCDD